MPGLGGEGLLRMAGPRAAWLLCALLRLPRPPHTSAPSCQPLCFSVRMLATHTPHSELARELCQHVVSENRLRFRIRRVDLERDSSSGSSERGAKRWIHPWRAKFAFQSSLTGDINCEF